MKSFQKHLNQYVYGKDTMLELQQKQVVAVLTAKRPKGCITAATYQIRLKISTACPIFPTLYNGPRDASKRPFPRRIRALT